MSDEARAPLGDPEPSRDAAPTEPAPDEATPAVPETVGTGSYVAVSCVAGMGLLLLVLIVGLLVSRWLG